MQIDPDWIPLKVALYGPDGLFPHLRMRDVLALVTPIVRTSRFTGLDHRFVTVAEVAMLRARIAA